MPQTKEENLAIGRRRDTWGPPSNLVTPLQEVSSPVFIFRFRWEASHTDASTGVGPRNVHLLDPLGFKNYGYDQVIAGNGT
jgi:hypothetical protein